MGNLLGYPTGYIDYSDILGVTNERRAQKSSKKLEAVFGYFAERSTQPRPWIKTLSNIVNALRDNSYVPKLMMCVTIMGFLFASSRSDTRSMGGFFGCGTGFSALLISYMWA